MPSPCGHRPTRPGGLPGREVAGPGQGARLGSTAALVPLGRKIARLCFVLVRKEINFEPDFRSGACTAAWNLSLTGHGVQQCDDSRRRQGSARGSVSGLISLGHRLDPPHATQSSRPHARRAGRGHVSPDGRKDAGGDRAGGADAALETERRLREVRPGVIPAPGQRHSRKRDSRVALIAPMTPSPQGDANRAAVRATAAHSLSTAQQAGRHSQNFSGRRTLTSCT